MGFAVAVTGTLMVCTTHRFSDPRDEPRSTGSNSGRQKVKGQIIIKSGVAVTNPNGILVCMQLWWHRLR
jgi:hypothetical protein